MKMYYIEAIEMKYFNQRFNIYAEGGYFPVPNKVYEKRDTLYRQVTDSPFVDFFSLGSHQSEDEQVIYLADGTVENVVGYRWSSRAGVINKYFPEREHLVEIALDGYHVAVTVSVVNEAIARLCPEYRLVKHFNDCGEITYNILKGASHEQK